MTFAIQWSYTDAQGRARIGITVHDALVELPAVVRTRVVRDLTKG